MPDPTNIGKSAADGELTREDRGWIDRFTMQMTSQGAAPGDISKALADVRAHCVDSGQSPYEAFGDPAAYATTLAAELPPAPRDPAFQLRRAAGLVPVTLGLTMMIMPVFAPQGNEAPVSVGQLLLIAVAIPVWVVLTAPWVRPRPRNPMTPDRRAFDEKGWRGLWITLVLAAVGAALWLGLDHTVFSVPKLGVLGLGLALFVAGMVLGRLLAPRTPDPRTTAPSP